MHSSQQGLRHYQYTVLSKILREATGVSFAHLADRVNMGVAWVRVPPGRNRVCGAPAETSHASSAIPRSTRVMGNIPEGPAERTADVIPSSG